MNKAELVDIVHERIGSTKATADEAVRATIDAISNAICAGDTVTLIGFGTFSVTERQARTGRNPQTGEPLEIAAKNVVKFSPGKALKDGVNVNKPAKKTEPAKSKRKC